MTREKKARRAGLFSPAEWKTIAKALSLSPRECEVVQCIFDNLAENEIAALLGVTANTVHTHTRRLYNKLGVRSRAALLISVFASHRELERRLRPLRKHVTWPCDKQEPHIAAHANPHAKESSRTHARFDGHLPPEGGYG